VENLCAVNFDWNRRRSHYTNVYLDVIKSVDARNVSDVGGVDHSDVLAVDWLADNLYWADAGSNVLEVSRLDGSCRKIVIGRTASRGCFPATRVSYPFDLNSASNNGFTAL
jgi:low-density lipoprotein receptor-related protein 4